MDGTLLVGGTSITMLSLQRTVNKSVAVQMQRHVILIPPELLLRHVERTASLLTSEFKQPKSPLVLGWGTPGNTLWGTPALLYYIFEKGVSEHNLELEIPCLIGIHCRKSDTL